MGSLSYSSEEESPVSIANPNANPRRAKRKNKKKKKKKQVWRRAEEEMEEEWPRRSRPGGGVTLEGYVEGADRGPDGVDGVGRTRSLTDDDLEELKGCLDLGFGFSYEEIPELCGTLPALELCYSMSRSLEAAGEPSVAAEPCATPPVANWKISSPGKMPSLLLVRSFLHSYVHLASTRESSVKGGNKNPNFLKDFRSGAMLLFFLVTSPWRRRRKRRTGDKRIGFVTYQDV
ncbi:hypothetical protein B296_00025394 [Ensete ventricosum]|uniref:Uncharacterized protein n=1 Tax=Ensete ventricosum TaxID=4639 RepID=A0A427ACB6_ENSVE|nr:hypothetical protein B296_00025394 [Ensete ventricosum]